MTLREKQSLFARLFAELVLWAYSQGYEVTKGEAWRPAITAAAYAAQGIGVKDSLHTKRLAEDMNLFRDGVFLETTEAHRPLGEHWKTMHPLCRWGGDFKDSKGRPKPDGNHYSLFHEGHA